MTSESIFSTRFPFTLLPLPYTKYALSPHINTETLETHHGKHHATYIKNLNKLITGTDLEQKTLEEIIILSHGKPSLSAIFNNAGQVWNHNFFWHSMIPGAEHKPAGRMLEEVNRSFGDYDKFIEKFREIGLSQFGSGWTWLVFNKENKNLEIIKTSNAETPLTSKMLVPLLTCDVWEHSYYLDYKNDRSAYINTFLVHLINWKFAEENFREI